MTDEGRKIFEFILILFTSYIFIRSTKKFCTTKSKKVRFKNFKWIMFTLFNFIFLVNDFWGC